MLLVKPTYKPLWHLPGGYVEPGETPRQACAREVAEDLGLDRAIGDLLVVDWAPAAGEGDKLLFVFDGGVLTHSDVAGISLDRVELERCEFFEPAAFADVLPDRLVRRVGAAVGVGPGGLTCYLEPGG